MIPAEPLVSIMLPARDAAGTLEAAAESCLDQTYENLELLLLENDSTPETREVMESLAARDKRVRVSSGEPGAGFIAALNRGWQSAQGALLARMDADDLAHPKRLDYQVKHLQSHPDQIAVSCQVRILRRCPASGALLPPLPGFAAYKDWLNQLQTPEAIAAERFIDSPVANPSVLMRREIFDRIGGYQETAWAEDYDFWLRALDSRLQIGKVPEILLDWIDGDSRLTRTHPRYTQDRMVEAKAHFLAKVPKVQERGVVVCGAGPIGKRLSRALLKEGVEVHRFLEVNPKRVGERIAGIPVHNSTDLPSPEDAVVMGAVGLPGARQRIRDLVLPAGFTEGQNFYLAA